MDKLSQTERSIWSCWETKTPREVAREAASKGTYVHLALRYLQQKNDWDAATANDWFTAEVFAWVLQLLARRQFFKASHVLAKIDVCPRRHMLDIASHTADKSLRDYVGAQLANSESNQEEQWSRFNRTWSLLKLLEKSFHLEAVPKQNRVFGSGNDIVVVTLNDLRTFTVNKLHEMPPEWKQRISTNLFADNFDFSVESFVNPEYFWEALLQRNMAVILKRWIMLTNRKEYDIDTKDKLNNNKRMIKADTNMLASEDDLEKLDLLLKKWTISNEMINMISQIKCFHFTKLYVYDALCSFGIILDKEKNNIKIISKRMCRTSNLSSLDSIIDKKHFDDLLVEYCIRHNLFHAMTRCFDRQNTHFDFDSVVKNGTKNCYDLWSLFKFVYDCKDVNKYIYSIYETCKYLSDDLSDYFWNNSEILIAMVLFDCQNLYNLFNEQLCLEIGQIKLEWNKNLTGKLPHLYSVYQRFQNDTFVIKNDVNIYQLLSGYKGLDISKIFEYRLSQQQHKSLLQSQDKIIEPPHFDNKVLVQSYGYSKKLNYNYYLKQNRPCSASRSFMIRQYQNFNRSTAGDVRNACNNAHLLALQNWNNQTVVSSCVSFISMIGSDSIVCRTHVSTAKSIQLYLQEVESLNEIDSMERIDRLFKGLIANNFKSIQNIYNLLIKSIEYKIEKNNHAEFGKVLNEWQTAIRFAYFHCLSPPEEPLLKFVSNNDWLSFLMFGDVFKYPQKLMLNLCKGFHDQHLVEHVTHSIVQNRTICDSKERRNKKEAKSTDGINACDVDFSNMSNDLWDIMSKCHGPDDPPRALIKASSYFHSPILALIATCYEPDAADVCWAQWLITSMNKDQSKKLLSSIEFDPQNATLNLSQMISIMKAALEFGYRKTLYESFLIFYRENALCLILKFIYKAVDCFEFDSKSIEILNRYKSMFEKRSTGIGDRCWSSQLLTPQNVQTAAVELIVYTLCNSFESAWHQKEFLDCICQVNILENFTEKHPDLEKLQKLLSISMRCRVPLDLKRICDDSEAQVQYVNCLIENKLFEDAMLFANVADLSVDDIFVAEWSDKYEKLAEKLGIRNADIAVLKFWADCCFAINNHRVGIRKASAFLRRHCDQIDNLNHRFYILRLLLDCYERIQNTLEPGDLAQRDEIEYEMWNTYLNSIDSSSIFLGKADDVYDYIAKLNVDSGDLLQDFTNLNWYKFFDMKLNEIYYHADLEAMTIQNKDLDNDKCLKMNNCIQVMLDNGLIIEAWRANKIFNLTPHSNRRNLITIVESSLKIAEGFMSPYKLSENIEPYITTIASPSSAEDIEEMVVVEENIESKIMARKRDMDSLAILDILAVRIGCRLVKQIADYYRIALQIGWTYERVLKYAGNPIDMINFVSGKSKMPLCKILLRTYEIPPQNFMEYLSLELATSLISTHVCKAPGYFHYTLWSYPLDSDFEMFLNMRPDDNATLGQLLLEYLSAFRKLCKTSAPNETENLTEEFYDMEQEDTEDASEYSDSSSIWPPFKAFNSESATKRNKAPRSDIISCTNIRISRAVKANTARILNKTKMSNKETNVITIELLILAHDCFSSVCDTQGIATVLRSAQTLASRLLAAKSWRLMVRLLTGIARYTEMAYIFQTLRDNDQFEFLLGQFGHILGNNEDKIDNFKLGMLEFLKKHCSGDADLFCMVALHFSMCSEAADAKKKQANDLIVAAKEMALDSIKALRKRNAKRPDWIVLNDDDSTELLLDAALDRASESAELYARAGCYGAARETAAFAHLIALQISLLKRPPVKCLFHLNHHQILQLLDTYLGFMEGLIFAHAVDVSASDWISQWKDIVYNRVLRGDVPFVKEISANRPDIAVYVIERYNRNKEPSSRDIQPIVELKAMFKSID